MTTDTVSRPWTKSPRKGLSIALWAVQLLLALFFLWGGFSKLATPADELAKMIPWTATHPTLKLLTGLVDLAGGLGILLPTLTRIQPGLTPLAAIGLIALQVLAMLFHASRGEWAVLPMNAVLIALSAFVLWGRGRALPVAWR